MRIRTFLLVLGLLLLVPVSPPAQQADGPYAFRPGPSYRVASPEEILEAAIELQRRDSERQRSQTIIVIVAGGLLVLLLAFRRHIVRGLARGVGGAASAGENFVVEIAAIGVRAKRRVSKKVSDRLANDESTTSNRLE